MIRPLLITAGILLLFFRFSHAQGQLNPPTEIYGKVTDATTKEPIPYANIRLIGSVKTAMTDPKGNYFIRTIEKADSIVFTFVGYRSRTIAVKSGKTQELNIEMGSDELKLVEVTVKAGKHQKRYIDTTANYVYYQVLKNKENNRSENFNNYKYDLYEKTLISLLNPNLKFLNFFMFKPFKFAFQNEDTTAEGDVFIPGLLRETVAKVYYRKSPKALRKYVSADVMSGIDNPSLSNMANYQFAEIKPYDNLFVIAGISFVAPFSPRAINMYRYYLTDTAQINGRTSYKLHFVGRVKEDVALKGYAWIDSATWAIRSINFRPNEKANFNFINDYTIKQDYALIDDKYWILQREDLHTVGSLFKKKHETSLLVTKLHDRKNIEVNAAFPDSVFSGVEELILNDSARNRSNDFWDTSRFEKLTHQEKEVYRISDTIKLVHAWKTYEWFGRFLTSTYADAGPISIGRILNFVSRNNVEGWRLRFGFETNPRFKRYGTPVNRFMRTFYFNGYLAYGLSDKVLQYQALTRIMLPRKNDHWQTLEGMYRFDMRVPGQEDDNQVLTFDNALTLISLTTFSKIMRVREFRIAYEKEWLKGFSTIVSTNYKTYYDIPGVLDFTHPSDGFQQNIPNFGVTEFMIDTRYSYNDQYFMRPYYRVFMATKYPVIMFRYTAGIVAMPFGYLNYHNLLFTFKQRISSLIGHTYVTLRIGKIYGQVPYTSSYMTEGNIGLLLNRLNYNLLNEFEFASDQYISLWIEHHFEGFFLNKIPGINKLRLREVIFAKGVIGNFSSKNADVLSLPSGLMAPSHTPYVEAGFGIENILHFFRVDFLWRATYRYTPGAPNWGVKIAFQPGF